MTVNSQELYFILDNTPSEQNIMLVGKHGIGKSRILEDYFSKTGSKVVTLFLGQMSDPGDLIGLPEKNAATGKTDFMLPYWFPTDNSPIVLFLDELNRARPEVLQTIMDLTLNRKLAGKQLPPGSRIISAVNNGNEYQLTDLDPALVSRFNIYEFAPTVQDWINWALVQKLDERIISFIQENPEYLDGFENTSFEQNLERTADRRSWERASKIIKNFKTIDNNLKLLLCGILGDKATAAFVTYSSKNNNLSAKSVLLEGPALLKAKINSITTADFSNLNNQLFSFIESFCDSQNNPDFNETTVLENFQNYVVFLTDNELVEVKAHLMSLCNSKLYPKTLALIAEKKDSLYKLLINL